MTKTLPITLDLADEVAGKGELRTKKQAEEAKEWSEKFAFTRELVNKLAQEWFKKYPKAGKGSWKYFLFNTVHWE